MTLMGKKASIILIYKLTSKYTLYVLFSTDPWYIYMHVYFITMCTAQIYTYKGPIYFVNTILICKHFVLYIRQSRHNYKVNVY